MECVKSSPLQSQLRRTAPTCALLHGNAIEQNLFTVAALLFVTAYVQLLQTLYSVLCGAMKSLFDASMKGR